MHASRARRRAGLDALVGRLAAPVAAFALVAGCGGGGGGDGATAVAGAAAGDDRPAVEKETVRDLQGPVVDGAPGRGYVHVCPGLPDAGLPRNVLIVAGGFSPGSTDREPGPGELDATCGDRATTSDHHLLVVRYRNGGDMIQRNGGLVRAAIEWAIDRYRLTEADRIALMGQSMGGLVTRYALQSMETAGRPHLVDLWVAVDAPLRGAYLPIGMQFLADLYRDRGGAEALATADAPAARQMLTHHYSRGASPRTWTDDHQRLFHDELERALGGFPKAPGLRRVGVASGRTGDALQAPLPGSDYVAGRLQVLSQTVPVREERSQLSCKASVNLDLRVVSTLVLRASPLGLQAGRASTVARSRVETRVAGYDVDVQDEVNQLKAYIDDRTTLSGLGGLCSAFLSSAKSAIVSAATDAAIAEGRRLARPLTDRYEKTFDAYGDGIHSAGAPGGRSNYIVQLRDALVNAGFSQEPGVSGGGTHQFVSVASALNIARPTGRLGAAELQALSPFDQIYVETDRNLDHMGSTSGFFGREVAALFRR
jgi:acetyl esterase/lipase